MVLARTRGGSIPTRDPETEKVIRCKDPWLETSKTRPYGKIYGLSEIVRAFKSYSARRINTLRHTSGTPVWQRNYYDHIIRNQLDLELTWEYIETNPGQWDKDEENPVK